jgi:hypothetical protein
VTSHHGPSSALARALTAIALGGAGAPAIAADCAPLALPAFDADAAKGPGWAPVPLSRLKRDTAYATAKDDAGTILKATAEGSASAFVHMGAYDPARTPVLEWRWRTDALIEKADNRDPKREDAPVRVIVGFDGDKSTLPQQEQRRFAAARKLADKDPPFATLMYIWDNRNAVGSVIASAHTSQVKMVVVESGPGNVGSWQRYRRNLVEDYRKAFGAPPGRIVGIAVMTDTDNTGSKAVGLYGAMRLACTAPSGP